MAHIHMCSDGIHPIVCICIIAVHAAAAAAILYQRGCYILSVGSVMIVFGPTIRTTHLAPNSPSLLYHTSTSPHYTDIIASLIEAMVV